MHDRLSFDIVPQSNHDGYPDPIWVLYVDEIAFEYFSSRQEALSAAERLTIIERRPEADTDEIPF